MNRTDKVLVDLIDKIEELHNMRWGANWDDPREQQDIKDAIGELHTRVAQEVSYAEVIETAELNNEFFAAPTPVHAVEGGTIVQTLDGVCVCAEDRVMLLGMRGDMYVTPKTFQRIFGRPPEAKP